ncbi:MAG: Bug family tripartite tricarboxylate transporter substrate binding protein [Burkholderiales bacterium]
MPICAALFTAMVSATAMGADPYPVRPLRFILPFPPGGPTDVIARQFGQKLGEALGQQVVPDNRSGAAGIVACEMAARALPDGQTLLLGAVGNLAINPHLYAKLPYDPVRDYAPVSQLTATPYVLVVMAALPARTVKELVALAKAKPGQLNYASGGVGTGNHFSAELFKLATGIEMVHVPYKGGNQALGDVLAGQVQLMFVNLLPALPHVKAGKLRALGVSGAARSSAAPDLPTIAEAGVAGFETSSWHGVLVPAKTPAAIVTRLYTELAKIARQPETKELMAAQGTEVVGSTPAEFARFIAAESAKWGEVIRKTGIRAE